MWRRDLTVGKHLYRRRVYIRTVYETRFRYISLPYWLDFTKLDHHVWVSIVKASSLRYALNVPMSYVNASTCAYYLTFASEWIRVRSDVIFLRYVKSLVIYRHFFNVNQFRSRRRKRNVTVFDENFNAMNNNDPWRILLSSPMKNNPPWPRGLGVNYSNSCFPIVGRDVAQTAYNTDRHLDRRRTRWQCNTRRFHEVTVNENTQTRWLFKYFNTRHFIVDARLALRLPCAKWYRV